MPTCRSEYVYPDLRPSLIASSRSAVGLCVPLLAGTHRRGRREELVGVIRLRVLAGRQQLHLRQQILGLYPERILGLADELGAAAAEQRGDRGELGSGQLLVHLREDRLQILDRLFRVVEREAPALQARGDE